MSWQLTSVYWGVEPGGPRSVDGPLNACQCLLLLLPPAQLAPQEAQDRGAEDDKDPGVHNRVEGEQTEHLEVLPVGVSSEEVHVHPYLRGTHRTNHT